MHRHIEQIGQIILDSDFLWISKQSYIGLAKLTADLLGSTSNSLASGLACGPNSPAALNVIVQPGEIYSLQNIDNTTYGSLAADTTHQIFKQGILQDSVILACAAPGTVGQSINYLVQAAFSEVDGDSVVLEFYNSTPPNNPWMGPGNSGSPSLTTRKDLCVVTVKAGTAAATGTQTTPAPDAGNIGLWVVTVANGQTAIHSGDITAYASSPFLAGLLNSHHNGSTGQAPKIKLASEVQGVLPYANMAPVRQIATGNMTLYCSPTGSDSTGDGSVGNPFLTSQHAFAVFLAAWDGAGFTATIDISAYTAAATGSAGYTATFTAVQSLIGFSSLTVLGNTGTPILVNITAGNCFESFGSSNFAISGVKLQASGSGTNGNGIRAADSAVISIGAGVQFGACGQSHITAGGHCEVSVNANYTINGNSVNHYNGTFGANFFCVGRTVTLTGTPAFSGAFASMSGSGTNLSTNGSTFSGAATGTRYTGTFNSLIFTGGAGGNAQLPGNANGSVATGAQIDVA